MGNDNNKHKCSNAKYLLVGAIDLGTSSSGWGYSFNHEYEKDPMNVFVKTWKSGSDLVTQKAPTSVLIKPDGKTLEAFGYDAENKYIEILEENKYTDYYFFTKFKMVLYKETLGQKRLKRNLMLTDVSGRQLPAMLVFSLVIEYLSDDLMKTCQDRLTSDIEKSSVLWVLTVPAIWQESAKQFMREAAIKAGIPTQNLVLALEPEAASIYCRSLPVKEDRSSSVNVSALKPGEKFMVLDAGGGTVDVTVHEIDGNGKLVEVVGASGGGWGSTMVDQAFQHFLVCLLGDSLYISLKQNFNENLIELERDFELKKRNFLLDTETIRMKFSSEIDQLCRECRGMSFADAIEQSPFAESVQCRKDKLIINANVIKGFFEVAIEKTVSHIRHLVASKKVGKLSAILMVGGFSDSELLKDAVRKAFPLVPTVIPENAVNTVLKGAAIYGHESKFESTKQTVTQRLLPFTYGLSCYDDFKNGDPESKRVVRDGKMFCRDRFSKHVEKDQAVKVGVPQTERAYKPLSDATTRATAGVYASAEKNPRFVDEESCVFLGTLTLEYPDVKRDGEGSANTSRETICRFTFSDTEVKVCATVLGTGRTTEAYFDFLDDN